MGTYKTNTRTVLDATLTSATSYSSGLLDVGDMCELAVDFDMTSAIGGTSDYSFKISRIAASGSAGQALSNLNYSNGATGLISMSIGSGLSANYSFGDQIQVDLVNPNGYAVTGTLSILGK